MSSHCSGVEETGAIERGRHGPLVGAVDQGTSSTRFLVSLYFIKYYNICTLYH